MLYESSDNENEHDYNNSTRMIQTGLKKTSKPLCCCHGRGKVTGPRLGSYVTKTEHTTQDAGKNLDSSVAEKGCKSTLDSDCHHAGDTGEDS